MPLAGFSGKNSAKKHCGKGRIFRECTGEAVNKVNQYFVAVR
jgi:hypothetical protein